MFITCWSAKGGVGTTVTTALLGLDRAKRHPDGVLLVDLCGDLSAVLGSSVDPERGLADWLATPDVPLDALGRLATELAPGLRLIGPGHAEHELALGSGRLELLAGQLAHSGAVIVDAGTLPLLSSTDPLAPVARHLAGGATQSLLVTRRCYLAVRRARDLPVTPTGLVIVDERFRYIDRDSVAQAIGVPVVLDIAVDDSIANAVDAGLLAARLPRRLVRTIEQVA